MQANQQTDTTIEQLRNDLTDAEHRAAAAEAELERLRKANADLGETNSALQAEARDQERDLQTCGRAFDELAEVLWGDGEGRPEARDLGVLATWASLRERLVAQLARAAAAAGGAETSAQAAATAAEVLSLESYVQRHEGILDTLWATVHPGQEQDDDAEPEELARQISVAWSELGRVQLEKEAAARAAVEQVQDCLSALQGRVAEFGADLRAVARVEGEGPAKTLLRAYADIFPASTQASPEDYATARKLVAARLQELNGQADIALGKQMGDAIGAVVFGRGR